MILLRVVVSHCFTLHVSHFTELLEKNVRISSALKIAIGKLNEVVSQIGMHQITG